jgi:hypothetical protein
MVFHDLPQWAQLRFKISTLYFKWPLCFKTETCSTVHCTVYTVAGKWPILNNTPVLLICHHHTWERNPSPLTPLPSVPYLSSGSGEWLFGIYCIGGPPALGPDTPPAPPHPGERGSKTTELTRTVFESWVTAVIGKPMKCRPPTSWFWPTSPCSRVKHTFSHMKYLGMLPTEASRAAPTRASLVLTLSSGPCLYYSSFSVGHLREENNPFPTRPLAFPPLD